MRVDRDAVAARRARREQRLDRGDDADPDDHHLARQHLAVRQPHARSRAVRLLDASTRRRRAAGRRRARGARPRRSATAARPRRARARGPAPRARSRACRAWSAPPPPPARYSRRRSPRRGSTPGSSADHPVDVGAACARAWTPARSCPRTQPPRRAAGRPDQRAVADPLARRRSSTACASASTATTASRRQQRHVALGPEARRADQEPLERLVAGQILLRQRRALVGQFGLVAEQRDRAGELRAGAARSRPARRHGPRRRSGRRSRSGEPLPQRQHRQRRLRRPAALVNRVGSARASAWASFSAVRMPLPIASPSSVSAMIPRALSPATTSK